MQRIFLLMIFLQLTFISQAQNTLAHHVYRGFDREDAKRVHTYIELKTDSGFLMKTLIYDSSIRQPVLYDSGTWTLNKDTVFLHFQTTPSFTFRRKLDGNRLSLLYREKGWLYPYMRKKKFVKDPILWPPFWKANKLIRLPDKWMQEYLELREGMREETMDNRP